MENMAAQIMEWLVNSSIDLMMVMGESLADVMDKVFSFRGYEILLLMSVSIVLAMTMLFNIDNMFLQVYVWLKRLNPRHLTQTELSRIQGQDESLIAIMVANWHEENVIEEMVRGNLGKINYRNYFIFLGVYPNDIGTKAAAERLAAKYDQVYVIENPLPGPTTKGQMLNVMAREIVRVEEKLGAEFKVFMIHDAEDIIHPQSLKLVNALQRQSDFVQVPVFSYDRRQRDIVGATYLDEFAEAHTRDLLAREAMGATIPSAGVGTAMSRRLILKLMSVNGGNFLFQDALTEDYFLGFACSKLGFKSTFACYYMTDENGKKDFIATLEYFPNKMGAAIRQKSRWVAGIIFQGRELVPWEGSLAERYFLYRDRSAPVNNLLVLGSIAILLFYMAATAMQFNVPEILRLPIVTASFTVNLIFLALLVISRGVAVYRVYGWKFLPLLPVRWTVANVINIFATLRAWRVVNNAKKKNQTKLVWEKTTHELPEQFKQRVEAPSANV